MNNQHGSTPANGQQPVNGQQYDQNGYPMNGQGGPQNGYQGQPQGGYPQGQPHPGYQQQWQQPEPPKKKNFFVRHKILTGLLALAVLIGLGSALAGGGKKDDSSGGTASASATSSGDASTSAKASEKSDALPALGAPIKDGNLQFTVTKVERGVASIGDQYSNKKAQGEYTLVHVSVKNVGTDAQTVSADDQKAYDAKGIGYKATTDGAIYIQGNDTLYTEINPGNTLTGILVFDAPKGTKLTKVRLHESMFSNGSEGSL